MASFLYEVSFWLVINLFLTAAVIGLVLIRYSMQRSSVRAENVRKGPDFSEEMMLFERLVEQGEKPKAVLEAFKRCFRKVVDTVGIDPRFLTPREVLESGKLPKPLEQALSEIYRIYEPVRFGLRHPSDDEIEVCRISLAKLAELADRNA
ncbi:MAG: hypothetical protein RMK31_00740 [Candidatus Caldarchaeum sp.]|nr:hypothetical protein [Candidatus Caldarchaeum sp.]MDW7978568.1 hypothetical protein [Candidatus Caldarchaeum sp.]MDW8359097.1 hypothetical protein [Candidatus Caldarchaeum sp.]